MKMDLLRGLTVNFAFRHGNPLEDCHRLLLDPFGKRAPENELFYFGEGPAMRMFFLSAMRVLVIFVPVIVLVVRMLMFVLVRMLMFVFVSMGVVRKLMSVVMLRIGMNIKFRSRNAGALLARDVEVVILQPQFLQLPLELMKINPQIQQRTDEHIAADAAENIEVNGFHSSSPAARALIWLAA